MAEPPVPSPERPRAALDRPAPLNVEQVRRAARLRARSVLRGVKIAAWMAASAVVIPVTMITGGWLLGPKGYEGVFLAPLSVLTAWGIILFVGLRGRSGPRRIQRADVRELPGRVAEWLDAKQGKLPSAAKGSALSLSESLEALELQVAQLPASSSTARNLRKLLVEELTPLVDGYLKLPNHLRRAPLHGGASPEQQVVEGLSTLDAQLRRLRDQLAQNDLHSLAAHQRYLALKYDDDD